ncbi:hypothetical protein LJC59_05475 [Desulfovibrio sp. OttesenSCG-928-A18]|nr:hypothetical protein [Desulfovibrio sp. OttesenSCG-928-A18]
MTTDTFYTRQMLMQYGRQLIAARRLARYNQIIGRAPAVTSSEASARRHAMVERIAREIMENLIFSGSDNPIVQEVKQRLAQELGEELIFRYPPADQDFMILRPNPEGGETALSDSEKQVVMGRLWNVTLHTVNETML